MKVYVVDNGGQWTHREWRVLKYLDVNTKIVPNTIAVTDLDCDGLVLSGGSPRVGTDNEKMGRTGEYLEEFGGPILGICAGFQFMALYYGGMVGPAEISEFGKTEIIVDEKNDLFQGLPATFMAWESHNDEIKTMPDVLLPLAHSKNCGVQAFKHIDRPLYGVQFHPEVEHTEHGYDIFKNFLRKCEE